MEHPAPETQKSSHPHKSENSNDIIPSSAWMDYIETTFPPEASESVDDNRIPKDYDYRHPIRSGSDVSTNSSTSSSIISSRQSESLSSEVPVLCSSSASDIKSQDDETTVGHESILPTGSNAGIDFMTSLMEQYQKSEDHSITHVPIGGSHSTQNTRFSHHGPIDSTQNSLASFSVINPKTFKSSIVLRSTKKRAVSHQRKAHSKIERKYRININSKIARLQKLVPWMCDDDISFQISPDGNIKPPRLKQEVRKLNKSMILDIVTRYIIHLKEENRILRSKVTTYESNAII